MGARNRQRPSWIRGRDAIKILNGLYPRSPRTPQSSSMIRGAAKASWKLERVGGWKPLKAYCTITDTLVMARKKHPGQRNSLDALCDRYGIDNSQRKKHGALLDAEILTEVYLAMTGG